MARESLGLSPVEVAQSEYKIRDTDIDQTPSDRLYGFCTECAMPHATTVSTNERTHFKRISLTCAHCGTRGYVITLKNPTTEYEWNKYEYRVISTVNRAYTPGTVSRGEHYERFTVGENVPVAYRQLIINTRKRRWHAEDRPGGWWSEPDTITPKHESVEF